MTIQRMYSLPNCTLLLEGLGDVISVGQPDARLPISMVINAECRLAGYEKPLSGGREFLEGLISAVSQYVQNLLSGVSTTRVQKDAPQLVQMERLSETQHRLTVRSQPVEGATSAPTVTQVDLNTVQLFDLVEAIDQLLADSQTLPDLTLNLKPVSRREVAKPQQVGKQLVPAAIGVSSLAAATVLLSLLPIPKVEQPKELFPVRQQTTATAGGSPSPTGSPSPSPTTSPAAAAPSPSPSPTASPNLQQLEANLTRSPEITDPTALNTLSQQLRDKLDQTWSNRTAITQDLTYQVGVRQDGTITGYKPVNPVSAENASKTPLLNLLSTQAETTPASIALYKVVFTGSGNVAVASWRQAMTSPVSGIAEITSTQELEAILPKLTSQINQNWAATPKFSEDLIYKVRVRQDGTVVDFSPENEAAARHVQETPLPKLGKPIADGNPASVQEPLALFKVVMQPPDGALEVSPWRGWQN